MHTYNGTLGQVGRTDGKAVFVLRTDEFAQQALRASRASRSGIEAKVFSVAGRHTV